MARILIEYVSVNVNVNVKVKEIMIIVEHSLIIYHIAGVNAAVFLPALAYNLILSV